MAEMGPKLVLVLTHMASWPSTLRVSPALSCWRQRDIDPRADVRLTQVFSSETECWQRFARLMYGSTESRHVGQFSTGCNSLEFSLCK